MKYALVIVLLLLSVSAAKCRGHATPSVTYQGTYVSLGDSVAAGNGASDKNATSFAALLAHDEGVQLMQVAVSGATTQDVIDKQLPDVVAKTAGMHLAFITISVGGNDLAGLIPNATCQQEPLPASCPLDASLAKLEANYTTILKTLRTAHPDTPIVLLAYPNFFSGTGHVFEAPAARVLPRLDDVIRRLATNFPHVAVADPFAAFEGRGPELTHVLDPKFDPHPTDAGHRIIADDFINALNHIN